MPPHHRLTMPLSPRALSIPPLGLWLLCSLVTSQEICSSPGTLPAPRLFLDRLSARQGDTVVLSCLIPLDVPMTRIVFCKNGKEISIQPKEGSKPVYDSPYPVSKESEGAFSCRYQLKDDNNQENNSHPSETWYLHVTDDEGSGGEASPQGPAIPQWVWILRSALVLLLLASVPIINCILRKRAVSRDDPESPGDRGEMAGGKAKVSGDPHCPGQAGWMAGITERSVDYAIVQKRVHGDRGEQLTDQTWGRP